MRSMTPLLMLPLAMTALRFAGVKDSTTLIT
jgi:hypothetical protein